ncbi:MAG TPA: DUF6524 family protein [Gammaproteobacteria bacterium]|nr:DUF6524 family protein [Gammaproteobacteria bacterium]
MERKVSNRDFSAGSFLWRLGATLVLVLATYNPTGFSYYRWLRSSMSDGGLGPEHFVAGIALVIGWTMLVVATQRSLGALGVVLGAALIGGIIWLLTDLGWIAVGSVSTLTWVSLVCLAVLLAVGLSWSHLWRRITGQYEVDDD